MGPSTLPEVSDFRLLGLDISTNVSWERYISDIAKSASMRVGCLYQTWKLMLFSTCICAEAPACHLSLLDRVQKRIVNLVGEELGSSLQNLSHRRSVASPCLFYIYFHCKCATSVSDLVHPVRPGCLSVKPGFLLVLTHTL